jgi:plasmid stabilization system protein ParE
MEPVTSTNTPTPTLHDLWRAGPLELAVSLRIRLEEQRRLDAEIGQILAEVDTRGAKATFGYGSTLAWLRDVSHLTTADAKKTLARALAVNPSRALDGTPIPARAPLTGTAAAEGTIGAGQIDTILAALKALPDNLSEDDRAGAEKILVDLAREAGPREIRRAGNRLRDLLDPDGSAPKDPPLKPDREVHFREHRDGSATMTAKLDPVTYANTRSVIDPLSKPHPATDEGRDTRSTGERQGDGFAEMVRLAMTSEELPLHGGDRTHIVVTLDYESLRSGIGKACLDVVGEITAAEARILACDCTIIPMALGSDSQPLDVGRIQRFVTPGQRRALHVRDRGCAFPGCHRKPRHCDAHHIIEWIDGGPTDLCNLTFLCGRHHRLLHLSGWEVRMATDGKPEFIPPDYLDPLRRPRRNTMHDVVA